ncbi:MAG: hypothetical protein M3211_00490 [Actinomycetota bacterium]|nr:hypothetical protein [Actinomycetota bacterium]
MAGWVDRFAARHGDVDVRATEGGIALCAPDGATATLAAPWPCAAATVADLVAQVQQRQTVGLLLVRRGGYAVGVAEGADLVVSKVGRRHVQGRTRAGGWSQQRYARRRDAQAREAFGAAADAATRTLLPHLSRLRGLVTGGDRRAVASVMEDPRLRPLATLPQSTFLAVPDPRMRVLEDAVHRSRAVIIDVSDPLHDTKQPH